MEERKSHDALGKAMSCIDEGGKKIHDRLKAGKMMEVEAGNKLIEFGMQKQSEVQGRLEDISRDIFNLDMSESYLDISKENDLVQKELSKKSGSKKSFLSSCTS